MFDDHEPQAPEGFLDTLEGEIALFRSIERARPVGMHKHFHMLTLRRSIRNESGVWVDVAAIWAKLATLYHLDALDDMDDQYFDIQSQRIILYPNSTDPNVLHNHPYFREFALPYPQFNDLMTARRAASPSGENENPKPRKRHLNAGLTNDDSELSDLTEGDDDGETDAATEPAEDGAEEEGEPEAEDAPTARRGTRKGAARGKVPVKGNRGKGTKKKKEKMFPNSPCLIVTQPNENLLTMEDGNDGTPLIIVPATGNPGEQEWVIEHDESENTVVIRNLKHDKYIGVKEPYSNASVLATSTPYKFNLEDAGDQNTYNVYTKGESENMYLSMSMLRMYPPQVALLERRLAGDKPWTFRFLD
ncbi:hypothetical protein FRC09_002696 [Ceratobasidium sp. 395]|nr:hypothetical protein FRC09_002696 [Ceratobasidium sp. 395]